MALTRKEKEAIFTIAREKEMRKHYRQIVRYYPDEGPLRRELYTKHLDFFHAGKNYRERLMLAANRVGKTEGVGGYEMSRHLTGRYPDWWNGRRFTRPISAWAAGDTGATVRDIVQEKLLGSYEDMGSGLVPKEFIKGTSSRAGIPGAIDTLYVDHISGGVSSLGFKSYDQKRKSFQGTKKDVVWLDEEPPQDVYTECLLRTMDTSGTDEEPGMIMATFTPLLGLSDVVLMFLPDGELKEVDDGSKYVVMATWDDAPHLSDKEKKILWDSIPPYQRDARSKGIPQLGSGAIYPVPETDILVDPFEIPAHWPRAYTLDVGWNRTAAIWAARDPETLVKYYYSEHYRGQAEPSVHAEAIRARGDWINGGIDPAARGRAQADGKRLYQAYKDLGLKLSLAKNSVESGIYTTWQNLSSGKSKFFNNLMNFKSEYRIYRRDEKGAVVKDRDHLMDCVRYMELNFDQIASFKPVEKVAEVEQYTVGSRSHGWMG